MNVKGEYYIDIVDDLQKHRIQVPRGATVRDVTYKAATELSIDRIFGLRCCDNNEVNDHLPDDVVVWDAVCNHDHPTLFIGINEQVEVCIKTLTGRTITIRTTKTQQIQDLKNMIFQKEEISVSSQRLIFDGKQLEDNKTLSDYNIQHGSIIHLVLRLGMMIPENGKNNFSLQQ
eukprot:TRINITY_DN5794_c0_g1_i1.p1 TRINITY_DN5794_c0_g1~~TRINITY_DN5794_c0_g1_i1.p1  ORF type:complete len:174 (+),score=30.76 TRINITY_DN5794_c0_g1_i1:40-561(+)